MADAEFSAEVAAAVDTDRDAFRRRVEREADDLIAEIRQGTFNNPQAIVGIEYETYAVDTDTQELVRVPRLLLELTGLEKELGLHNSELHTHPHPLNRYGLAAQQTSLQAQLESARGMTAMEDITLVSDGMWTLPPTGETAHQYLTASVEDDGVVIATNMSDAVRYHAMSNSEYGCGLRIEAPHMTLETETVMPVSLTTSIQPHYQVAHAPDIPRYFRYAIRIAGPLLALSVNSPFFPPDLYDDEASPEAILEDGWMEHRIPVFEGTLNADGEPKVRFPRDATTVEDLVRRLAEDPPIVPELHEEPAGRFDDRFRHLRHKHGSYWRWVRPVFEGATRSTANARLEFRPLANQPTIRDTIAFEAAFAGLMEELFAAEHPIIDLEWELAKENFYAAMRDGLDAELTWITGEGERTTKPETVYGDLFEYAHRGLVRAGLPEGEAEDYLWPLRCRVEHGTTPAAWKRAIVRNRLEAGADFASAVYTAQRAYIDRQAETLIEGSFHDWLDPSRTAAQSPDPS